MGPYFGLVVISLTIALVQAVNVQSDYVPMVAFVCNKPAMHRVANGWEYDKTTDCIEDKVEILKYCQQLYPDHEITNIVEASQRVSISNWPNLKGNKKHRISVRPFRCIVGPFQSDALLVPQHCVFDHHHNTSICDIPNQWNMTASRMCKKRNMTTESFAMLLECGVDRFNGVEFVCCPHDKASSNAPGHLHVDNDDDDDGDDDGDDEEEEEEEEDEDDAVHPSKTKTMAANKPVVQGDAYHQYLKGQKGDYENEHEWFLSARKSMRKEQQGKMTKLMKEWQAAREHVSELRKSDPKDAQSLNQKITERFQSLYGSYEQEDQAEKKQIVALHQQHVQGDLNKRKRVAMEKYMNALQNKDAHKALKYLRAYYRAEEKDKMHTVNHYQHIKYTEPAELPRIRHNFQQHIMLIDQRLNQSLQMLSRYPDIQEKVKPEIEKFALRYRAVDASAINVILNDADASPTVVKKPDVDSKSDEDSKEITDTHYDPETNEDEHAYEHESHHPEHDDHFIAHVVDNRMGIDDRSDQEIAIRGISNQVGSTFGIAIGSVAVFVIIVVAIVMLRRRNHRQPVTHGYVEVDPAASPEERHVANMQMNGYENPTYRYFEMSNGQQQQQQSQ